MESIECQATHRFLFYHLILKAAAVRSSLVVYKFKLSESLSTSFPNNHHCSTRHWVTGLCFSPCVLFSHNNSSWCIARGKVVFLASQSSLHLEGKRNLSYTMPAAGVKHF